MDAVDVAYVAPAPCPSDAIFWAAFAARAPTATRVARGAWSLEVAIDARATGFHGALRVLHAPDEPASRAVDDASCAAVVDALAAIAAVRFEASRAPPPLLREEEPPPRDAERTAREDAAGLDARVGVSGVLASYAAPSASLGLGAFAEIEDRTRRAFGVRVRLSFQGLTGFWTSAAPATALVTSWLGRAEVGVVRFAIGERASVGAAAVFEAGALVGEARDVPTAQRRAAPWAAFGAALRLRVAPRSGPFIEAAGGPIVPVTRPRFVFQPGPVVVYEAPPIGASAELSVGMHFL